MAVPFNVPKLSFKSSLYFLGIHETIKCFYRRSNISDFQLFRPEHYWRDIICQNACLVHQNWYRMILYCLICCFVARWLQRKIITRVSGLWNVFLQWRLPSWPYETTRKHFIALELCSTEELNVNRCCIVAFPPSHLSPRKNGYIVAPPPPPEKLLYSRSSPTEIWL
jgi:hypothetical protein